MTKPIVFGLRFAFTDEELNEIFNAGMFEFVKQEFPNTKNEVEVRRQIINIQGVWQTLLVKWAGLSLVVSDAVKLGVDNPPVTKESETTNPLQHQMGIKPEELNVMLSRLAARVKGSFKFITVARDGRNDAGFRATLTDEAVQNKIWSLDQAITAVDEELFSQYDNAFTNLTEVRLNPAQGKLMVRKGQRRFPLALEGGGVQSSTNLLFKMLVDNENSSLLAIEEPENHFHPGLQRRLLEEFRKLAGNKQLFISTHSSVFVTSDRNIKTWLVKLAGNETQATVIAADKKHDVLDEMGIRLTDVLFSSKVVFVEGKSDKLVLEAYAEKMGIDLVNMELIPTRGKSNASRALDVWLGIARDVVPMFVIMDRDATEEVQRVVDGGLIAKENVRTWQKGSIESYYPYGIFSEALGALNTKYSLGIEVDKVMKDIQIGRLAADRIDIGSKRASLDKAWEVLLAEEVAMKIRSTPVEVPQEVREVLMAAVALPN